MIILVYGVIALPWGFASRFLQLNLTATNWLHQLKVAFTAIIFPAFSEELVFRVLLLPHPREVINWEKWAFWAVLMLIFFILYHPLNAKTFFPAGFPTFFHPVFLTLAGLLGLGCTLAYALTGSLWVSVFIHWFIVTVWLIWLGGIQKLSTK